MCIARSVAHSATSPALSLLIEPSAFSKAMPLRPIHDARQTSSVDLELHVGQREGDRLVLDDLLAELLALARVVERVLVGGAGDAERLRADRRAGGLEGCNR